MATNDPIYDEALKSARGFYDISRQKGIEDIQRSAVVSRRRSYSTPEDITNFSKQYDMAANRDLSQMAIGQQDKRANEVNMWGGVSPHTGATIQGQLPYQSQQNEIQRAWNRKLQEDQWNAQREIANQQASGAFWGAIGGGIGSIFGGALFGGLGSGISNLLSGGGKQSYTSQEGTMYGDSMNIDNSDPYSNYNGGND